jgi:hypothetical protein
MNLEMSENMDRAAKGICRPSRVSRGATSM